MKKYIFAHPFLFIMTVLLSIITQSVMTGSSLLMMHIIDSITTQNMDAFMGTVYTALIFVIVVFISLYFNIRSIITYLAKTSYRLKQDVFAAIMNTNIASFHQLNSAQYISLLNNDIKLLDSKYFNAIIESTKFIVTIVIALGAMTLLSPVNALVALVLASPPLILPIVFGKKLAETNLQHMNKLSQLNEKTKDFLHGFEVIKTFGVQDRVKNKFSASAADVQSAGLNAAKVSAHVSSISAIFMIASQIITYLVAGYFVITGNITIGAVVAIAGLSGSIMSPINMLTIYIADIKSTKSVRTKILNLLHVQTDTHKQSIASFKENITLNNVSYVYKTTPDAAPESIKKPQIKMIQLEPGQSAEDVLANMGLSSGNNHIMHAEGGFDALPKTANGELDIAALLSAHGMDVSEDELSQMQIIQYDVPFPDKPPAPANAVLKNFSYTFENGKKYAIVGASGSGKSTLLKILMGYYDDYYGDVCIGDVAMRDICRKNLYEHVTMMHQNIFLLDDSLYNNITLSHDYHDDVIAHVIKKAQLNDVIDQFPDGLFTKIGEGGNILSGGEKQRIAIARALIKGSEIMMFDEAMSSLDNETAANIERTLLQTEGLTTISVTHRYNKALLKLYDNILVMKDGTLIETGTFDELYERKDYFYSLYNIAN